MPHVFAPIIRDERHAKPALFASDSGFPRRLWLQITLVPGRLTIVTLQRYHGREFEYRLDFCRWQTRRLFVRLFSWWAVVLGHPFPITADSLSIRQGHGRRPRLSIRPLWPLDFTLHIYETKDTSVQAIVDTLLMG